MASDSCALSHSNVTRSRSRSRSPRAPLADDDSPVALVFSEMPAECVKGHTMERRTLNPVSYSNQACCDICGLPDLPGQRADFFHCPTCKFDKCLECTAVALRYRCSSCSDGKPRVIEIPQDTNAVVAAATSSEACRQSAWASRVWTSAPALSRHLESLHAASRDGKIDSGTVGLATPACALELGCGSALVSLVLASLHSENAVLMTDRREALSQVHASIERNAAVLKHDAASTNAACRWMVRPLDWMQLEDVDALRTECVQAGLSPPNLIIAADVTYEKKLLKPFMETLVALQQRWIRPAGKTARLFIAHERRGLGTDRILKKGLKARGIPLHPVKSAVIESVGKGRVELLQGEL
eukprot:TRINITY_DN58374_c0_g1_i1.p1 TRINITY_DN58374_c0_g1~~TRINITY_DN58374_c0_g1_i1.p1  ORF type:complete len:371 (+),score=26.12 TRINITY_DN58374_c0_g1_i1:46-1113(+)